MRSMNLEDLHDTGKRKQDMCIQSLKCSRRVQMGCLLLGVTLVALTSVVVGRRTKLEDDGCMGEMRCLPISKCEGHINPDFTYGCGDHDTPKICCFAKFNNKTTSVRTSSRLKKMALFPKKCGMLYTDDKISNGVNASMGQFPWMAILGHKLKNLNVMQYTCAGTIINQRYVLTAAHCLLDKTPLTIATLGELNLETKLDCEFPDGITEVCADPPVTLQIEKTIPHPKYNKTSLKNDIALLRLERNISKFTDFIQPVCLPFGFKIDAQYFRDKNFTIAGWGKVNSASFAIHSVLQYTRVQTWELNRCNDALPARVKPVNRQQVCATGSDFQEACKGDSGGPLTDLYINGTDIKHYQIGVVSFKTFDTCGSEEIPTVFTRIDKYLDWIVDNIEP